jgi:arylformamidase
MRAWKENSARARSELAAAARLDIRYGHRPRQTLDWFGVAGPKAGKPVHVFIHGGFWQESSKDSVSFLALPLVASGSQFVAIGYTLAPQLTFRGIIDEVEEAFRHVQANASALGGDPARILVSGHSAGAYLAASLMLRQVEGCSPPAAAILVSGVFDLEPVSHAYVNRALGLSSRDATGLSLTHKSPAVDIPLRIVVGSDETAEFRRQSRQQFGGWRRHLSTIEFVELPGRDHFDVLFDAVVYSDLNLDGSSSR